MTGRVELDATDQAILDRLRHDGREPAATIARHVGVTAAAVRRRIQRLQERGVISRFTITIDHDKTGATLEAYIELSFGGNVDVPAALTDMMRRRQVREAVTFAGEPDALLRVRVSDHVELRELVIGVREDHRVTKTKTMIALDRHWHGATEHPGATAE